MTTIGFIYATLDNIILFNKEYISKKLGTHIENITFVYYPELCNSCFTPLIKCNDKLYDLSLNDVSNTGGKYEKKL